MGELRSKGDGSLVVNWHALNALNLLRKRSGFTMILNSAYRDPEHNRKVGGAKQSFHLIGRAFDVSTVNWMDAHVVSFIHHATLCDFRGFGLYLDRERPFIHIDTGPHRTWQVGQNALDDTDDVYEIL